MNSSPNSSLSPPEKHSRAIDTAAAAALEAQQEALLAAKYGGLPKKHLLPKKHSRKHFDSADWALQVQGAPSSDMLPSEQQAEPLPAVLQPPLTPTVSRRMSSLGA